MTTVATTHVHAYVVSTIHWVVVFRCELRPTKVLRLMPAGTALRLRRQTPIGSMQPQWNIPCRDLVYPLDQQAILMVGFWHVRAVTSTLILAAMCIWVIPRSVWESWIELNELVFVALHVEPFLIGTVVENKFDSDWTHTAIQLSWLLHHTSGYKTLDTIASERFHIHS